MTGCNNNVTLYSVFRILPALAVLLIAAWACQGENRTGSQTGAAPSSSAAYRIEGTVRKAGVSDHSGIQVFLAGTSLTAYTDEEGSFTIAGIPSGKYRVRAQAADYEPALLEEIVLEPAKADPNRPYRVAEKILEPKRPLNGEADLNLSSIVGTATLRSRPSSEGIAVRVEGENFATFTNAAGQFQLLRLDPGDYILLFEKEGYRPERLNVRLGRGDIKKMIKPVVLNPIEGGPVGRMITGAVALVDEAGQPVADRSNVVVYLEGTNQMLQAAADGSFAFSNLAAQRYVVAAVRPGFAGDMATADLTSTATATVSLLLRMLPPETTAPAPGALAGRVLKDDPGDPLIGITVGLVEAGMTAMTDAEGAYTFSNVAPGTYTLVAQANGYVAGMLRDVAIPEGVEAQAIDLTLEKQRDFPRVLNTIPAAGDPNVVVREVVPVIVRFSKQMRPEALRAAFTISPPVMYRLYAGREHQQSDFDRLYVELIGFGGRNSLHFNSNYTVTISPVAVDFEGLPLRAPFTFNFRTGRAAVTGTAPQDGAQNVFLDLNLYRPAIYLNAPLDPRSLRVEQIRIRPAPRSALQVSSADNLASGWSQIQIIAAWQPGVRYTVTVGTGLRTTDGSPISNLPYTFTFTTDVGRQIRETPRPERRGGR
jgi:hypothetical protein